MDFFTTEVWTVRGLVTYYVLFVIDLRTRRVHFAGTTTNPGESFMVQIVRNLTDTVDGFLASHRFLICDRDAKFTARFRQMHRGCGGAGEPDPRDVPGLVRGPDELSHAGSPTERAARVLGVGEIPPGRSFEGLAGRVFG